MPGPEQLAQVFGMFHTRDRTAALAGLCQYVAPGQTGPGDNVVALAWASPDMARTSGSLIAPFLPLAHDGILGAAVVHVRLGRLEILIEQPQRQAGLAAYVSRYGEGVAAIYLERPHFVPSSHADRRPPRPLQTPLGRRGWLLPHEWPWGPFIIALEPRR